MTSSPRRAATGLAWALAAYLAWGLLPLYVRALAGVPALEILAHRVVWSVLLLAALAALLRRGRQALGPLATRRGAAALGATTVLIAMNWLTYIWAVNAGRTLEASLGYFMNPLVNVLLGVLFLGETLTRRQKAAIGLAGLGVGLLLVRTGSLPWVSLLLAISFALYGLVRKVERIDPVGGLLVETGLLAPLALGYISWLGATGEGHLGASPRTALLLVAAGPVTALPLISFALGVERLRYSTVGLVQYVAPSLQFAIAVLVFREPFGAAHAAAFACIWASLVLYGAEAIAVARRAEAGTG